MNATATSTLTLHGVSLKVEGCSIGPALNAGHSITYANLITSNLRPRSFRLKVDINVYHKADQTVLVVSKGEAIDLGVLHRYCTLEVPVQWKGQPNEYPFTREKDVDNVDIILLDADGNFINVQVSLVTCGHDFYVGLQQVYRGHVVRTHGGRFDFVPTDAIHAYPGCNYGEIWQTMSESLASVAKEEEASMQKSRVRPARWQSAYNLPERKGWSQGTVGYYNFVTRFGQILEQVGDDEYESYFVHFTNLLDEKTGNKPSKSTLLVFEPGRPVYFKKGEPGKASAAMQPKS